jgi:hypothetical protein
VVELLAVKGHKGRWRPFDDMPPMGARPIMTWHGSSQQLPSDAQFMMANKFQRPNVVIKMIQVNPWPSLVISLDCWDSMGK